MSVRSIVIGVALLISVCANDLFADIWECDGIIQNRPCPGGAVVMQEKKYVPPTKEELEQRTRSRYLDSLEAARLTAKRRYDIDYDTSVARTLCESGPLADCITGLQSAQDGINQRIADAQRAKSDQQQPEPQPQPPSKVITIIQNNLEEDQWWPTDEIHHPHSRPTGDPYKRFRDRPPPISSQERHKDPRQRPRHR